MSSQSKAGLFSAIAEGAKGYDRGVVTREEAQVRKAQGQEKLRQLEYRKERGIPEQEIEVLASQNRDLQNKFTKMETYNALDRYTADGNPKHLQRLIQETPNTLLDFSDPMRIDYMNDKQLIIDAGGDPEDFTPTNPNYDKLSRRFIKAKDENGQWGIVDMAMIYAGSGYKEHLDAKRQQSLLIDSQIQKNLRTAEGVDTALQKNAKAVANAKERIKNGTGTAEDRELVRFGVKETAGTMPGKLEEADVVTANMLEKVGGEEKFWSMDVHDPKVRNALYSDMNKIMQLQGTEWTSKDREELHNIRTLTALGDPGKDLTEEETGVMDSLLLNVRKYINEEVEDGVAATSAYSAFRNTVRHALYGSALTESEIQSFNEAFGTLGQKLGPVLQQFKTSLSQVKAKLSSISELQNPYVSKYFLGADQDKLDSMLNSIQQRIDHIDGMGGKKARKPISEIMGGKKQ